LTAPSKHRTDIAIVGAGIVGLAHAVLAARSGRSVTVFERNPVASGASVRNFGMIWPIGQPPGPMHELAMRSCELWLSVLAETALPYFDSGSLHAAYQADEAAVAVEFAEKTAGDLRWLNRAETLARSGALREANLLGALWSPSELTVDPRLVLSSLPAFLRDRYAVRFCFDTAVRAVETNRLWTGDSEWRAEHIIVAPGDDFQSLFAAQFAGLGLTRCKLQMLRTVAQPAGWRLGPALAFGLSFRHYRSFEICPSLRDLKARVARDHPELDRWGIHVMASQTAAGEVTIGDSHEYGLAVNIFDKPLINRLILEYAEQRMRLPSFDLGEQWHGVYAKHPEEPYVRFSPCEGVHVVAVTTGAGMTLSFGLAEETLNRIQ
jgi:FAD dependent oxidoreductase TIGR03364